MRHFEKNDCKPKDQQGISSEQFEVQRAETAMVMQNRIKIADEYGELAYLRSQTQGPSFGGSIAQSSVVGGVPIAPSEQPDLLNEDADIPASSRPTNQEQRSSPAASEATTDLLGLKSENNYSALNATNLAALNKVTKEIDRTPKATIAEWPVVGKDKEGLVEGMSNVNLGGNMAFPVPMMPDLSVAPPSVQPSRSGFSDVGDASNAIELQPNQFTGLWECPFYKCR